MASRPMTRREPAPGERAVAWLESDEIERRHPKEVIETMKANSARFAAGGDHRWWEKPDLHAKFTYEEKWGLTEEERALFSTEGMFASAVGADGMLFLWPADRLEPEPPCARCAKVHNGICTDFVIDWKRMASISVGQDCLVRVWDLESDRQMGRIMNNSGNEIDQIFLSVDGELSAGKVAVGAAGGPIKVGDLEAGKLVTVLKGHKDDVHAVRADWDAHQVVSAAWDRRVHVYDVRANRVVRSLKGHEAIINRMDVDFGQQLAVTVGWEKEFFLWDLTKGELIKSYPSHHCPNDICVDWQNMIAATGADDGFVSLWSLETGECMKTIDCQHDQTLALDVNWTEGLLLTGSWDKQVKLFDIVSGKCLKEFKKARRVLSQCWLKK